MLTQARGEGAAPVRKAAAPHPGDMANGSVSAARPRAPAAGKVKRAGSVAQQESQVRMDLTLCTATYGTMYSKLDGLHRENMHFHLV